MIRKAKSLLAETLGGFFTCGRFSGRHAVQGCSVKRTSERAIAMSHEKYCSASIMLGKTAQITTGFELVEG